MTLWHTYRVTYTVWGATRGAAAIITTRVKARNPDEAWQTAAVRDGYELERVRDAHVEKMPERWELAWRAENDVIVQIMADAGDSVVLMKYVDGIVIDVEIRRQPLFDVIASLDTDEALESLGLRRVPAGV